MNSGWDPLWADSIGQRRRSQPSKDSSGGPPFLFIVASGASCRSRSPGSSLVAAPRAAPCSGCWQNAIDSPEVTTVRLHPRRVQLQRRPSFSPPSHVRGVSLTISIIDSRMVRGEHCPEQRFANPEPGHDESLGNSFKQRRNSTGMSTLERLCGSPSLACVAAGSGFCHGLAPRTQLDEPLSVAEAIIRMIGP